MRTIILLMSLLFLQCNTSKKGEKVPAYSLKFVWETTGFETPESVCFDSKNNVFYVSNIGGTNPAEKDGNGFISKLNRDGSINQLKWIEGLNAPKGMGIFEGLLYVTDINKIVVIDIASGKINAELSVANSGFLNDIAVGKDGAIYFSDSQTSTFFKLSKGESSPFVIDESFESPNGIIIENDSILAGIGNSIIQINSLTGSWKKFIDNTGGIDGLAKINEGDYIISDWVGNINMIYNDKNKELLLDTTATRGKNAADFCYVPEEQLLLVPTFFSNSICCYKLEK